jgi:hypothetical protein
MLVPCCFRFVVDCFFVLPVNWKLAPALFALLTIVNVVRLLLQSTGNLSGGLIFATLQRNDRFFQFGILCLSLPGFVRISELLHELRSGTFVPL